MDLEIIEKCTRYHAALRLLKAKIEIERQDKHYRGREFDGVELSINDINEILIVAGLDESEIDGIIGEE